MAGIKFSLMVVPPEIIVFILATFVAVIGFGFKVILGRLFYSTRMNSASSWRRAMRLFSTPYSI
jgi:hypothetical protein